MFLSFLSTTQNSKKHRNENGKEEGISRHLCKFQAQVPTEIHQIRSINSWRDSKTGPKLQSLLFFVVSVNIYINVHICTYIYTVLPILCLVNICVYFGDRSPVLLVIDKINYREFFVVIWSTTGYLSLLG